MISVGNIWPGMRPKESEQAEEQGREERWRDADREEEVTGEETFFGNSVPYIHANKAIEKLKQYRYSPLDGALSQ